MAVVTVTGGLAQPAIRVNFDASRTTTEARSLGYLISQEFKSASATYVSSTQNTGGVSTTDASGAGRYLIIDTPGTLDVAEGFKAITVVSPATVSGGSSEGQQVIAQGDFTYGTTFQGGEIVVSGGDNTIGLFAGLNTVYGGSGSDTINVLSDYSGSSLSGLTTIYAGDGATQVNVASGAISVVGSVSATATLLVEDGGGSAAYVDGGFGRLVDYDAAGTVIGGAAGSNVIVGSHALPVTITGGGTNDYLEGNTAGTMINAADDGTLVDVFSGGETVNSGYGTTTINVGAGPGTVTINGGSGAFQISVASGEVSFTGGVGGGTFFGGAGPDTVIGGEGSIYATAGSGYLQGGSDGNNTIIGGSGNSTLAGAGNGDYLQAGSGNTSLIGSTGANYSMLVAGTGSDTLVGTANASGVTNFSFTQVSGVSGSNYEIDHFNPSTVSGSTGENIYVANPTDALYVISHAVQVGADVVTSLNGSSTITLANTTIDASGRINGTDQTLAGHIKSVA